MTDKKMICFECSKNISLTEHYVTISTFNRFNPENMAKLPDDHTHFHFRCFVDNFNKNVKRKARQSVQFMQGKTLEMLNNPTIKNVLQNIQGSDALIQMLQTPLDEKEVLKEKIIEKIKKEHGDTGTTTKTKKRKNNSE